MGNMRHHAIVVTGKGPAIENAFFDVDDAMRATASVQITELAPLGANGFRSFLVVPDGGNEGWSDSDAADRSRVDIVEILRGYSYKDVSSPIQWVEVMFGDDEGKAAVVSHSGEWQ